MSRGLRVEEVLRFLGLGACGPLEELRREGLFLAEELEPEEADELRVAVALMRDLGVNAAGVDVVLHLRRRLLVLESRVGEALERLLEEGET